MALPEYLHVACIVGAHGVRGEVRVNLLAERPQRLQELSSLSLLTAGGLFVRDCRFSARQHQGQYLLKLEGVEDRDAALALKAHYLSVPRAEAAVLPEGRYYICDLLGLELHDETRGRIGRLKQVLHNGAQDVYEIERPEKKPLYLPVTNETFIGADLAAGQIDVRLPLGLWEVYE